MARTKSIDWGPIEARFVTGQMSQRELSDEFNVSYEAVRMRAYRHGWKQKRAHFKEGLQIRYIETIGKDLLKIKAEFDDMTERICRVSTAHAALILAEYEEGNIDLKSSQIQELLDILARSQAIIYRRLDIPTPVQRVKDVSTESPADAIPLSDIDLDIDAKVKTARYVEMKALPAPDDSGNGKGNGQDGDTDAS